jgi:hypothetical protein
MATLGLAFAMSTTAHAQWLDDFDTYTPGPLAAQSLWDEWTGSTGVDADVVNTRKFSAANSVLITQNDDVVYDFTNLAGGRPTSGKWISSIKAFVPLGTTGIGWYIIMNDYPTNLQWSLQTSFNASTATVNDGTRSATLKFGRWVSLVCAIDLDANRYDLWYGDQPITVNGTWASGGSSQQVIAALDLYGDSGGLSGLYYDNARLETGGGGPLVLTSKPNPAGAGLTLDLYSNSPLLGLGDLGVLFNWTVNGSLVIFPLFPVSFDANGDWTFSTIVPAGLSGIEAGLKMFALPAGGKVMVSNEDLIIFS